METTTKRETISIECKPKTLFSELIWVLKARSKDPNRAALQYMLKDETGIVCTDGAKLHHFKGLDRLPKLENGLYDVQVLKDRVIFIPVDFDFPEYKRVLPHYTGKSILLDLGESAIDISRAMYRIFSEFGNGVNYEMLKDLAGQTWMEVRAEKDRAIEFKNGDCYALLMPINLKF